MNEYQPDGKGMADGVAGQKPDREGADGQLRSPLPDRQHAAPRVIYWTKLPDSEWGLHLAATDKGLLYVGSRGRSLDELETWVSRRIPGAVLQRQDERLRLYAEQMGRYLRGEAERFELPLDVTGTAFQQQVWRALTEIPYGESRTYSAIAERIGRPAAVRAVGTAIGANPLQIVIPCHRVLGKSGALTGFRGGLEMKAMLLALEGCGLDSASGYAGGAAAPAVSSGP
ncbi:methylated-DNA--[protein]-cysteine S-methyltransferase [Gorillibacterium sp. sgz500922]|uniref:methylated-DNA--[protein]-cysteine S-methyltransferase n=1 Tax=Gorillibacterium sp. sgz500922 TaxID=3446694 RepID=UPI003F673555